MSIIKDVICHDIIIGKPTKIQKLIYSEDVINNIINESNTIELYGTLDIPQNVYQIDLSKIAFKVNKISIRKRKLLFNIEILDTPDGLNLQSIKNNFSIKCVLGVNISNNNIVKNASLLNCYTKFNNKGVK